MIGLYTGNGAVKCSVMELQMSLGRVMRACLHGYTAVTHRLNFSLLSGLTGLKFLLGSLGRVLLCRIGFQSIRILKGTESPSSRQMNILTTEVKN